MAYATIHGAKLYYDEMGEGEPIILQHGYTGSHEGWDGVAEALREGFRCIRMDWRGAGDSEHTKDGYSIAQFAQDVLGLADSLGLERFTYAGHSMGGTVGYELGAHHAARLDRLILVAPAPSTGVEVTGEMRERGRILWKTQARDELLFDRVWMTARELTPEMHQQSLERALAVSEQHLDDCLDALIDYRPELAGIGVPTLMVAGAADSFLHANLLDFLQLPNATLHVFSRVSHSIPREVPEELAEVIADFCKHGVVTAEVLQERLWAEAERRAAAKA